MEYALDIPGVKSMAVTVKLNLPLQKLAGNREKVEVAGATVKQCLDDLVRQIPEAKSYIYNNDGSLALLFLLNNKALYDQDMNHPLAEDDELWLLSVLGGG
jgi:molybdopterin converting factor small subunit